MLPETLLGLPFLTLALVLGIVGFGGLVKGLAGFGYAIASTAILAAILPPATAVVIVILPMLAANLTLLGELDRSSFRSCVRRFWPFVAAAAVGTVAGMLLLRQIPTRPLALVLGAFTLAYTALKQDRFLVPGETWVRSTCFRPTAGWKAALGLVSGLIFGGANVAVQVVAYLDSLDLDRSTFVGVLAMLLVGISTLRVGLAATLGFYRADGVLAVSVLAAVPGLAGVAIGKRLRTRLPDDAIATGVVLLLAVIGVRLSLKGIVGI